MFDLKTEYTKNLIRYRKQASIQIQLNGEQLIQQIKYIQLVN